MQQKGGWRPGDREERPEWRKRSLEETVEWV